jgi:hypothetical protein
MIIQSNIEKSRITSQRRRDEQLQCAEDRGILNVTGSEAKKSKQCMVKAEPYRGPTAGITLGSVTGAL